jgi:hypothetical protein
MNKKDYNMIANAKEEINAITSIFKKYNIPFKTYWHDRRKVLKLTFSLKNTNDDEQVITELKKVIDNSNLNMEMNTLITNECYIVIMFKDDDRRMKEGRRI